ncbi:MAG: DUF1638 domain-containing protein [Candidatus Thiodiazotropha sp.]
MSTLIACSIFRDEIETLKKEGMLPLEVKYIPSMLHLNPAKLDLLLQKELIKRKHEPIALVYGDCCPSMLTFSQSENIERPEVRNCCELILGRDGYMQHLRQGAFFLMPEWVRKWRGIFISYMKLNKSVAVDMMQHMHRYFLYLDTGIVPIPKEKLDKISNYFELPWRLEEVDIRQHFLSALLASIKVQEGA